MKTLRAHEGSLVLDHTNSPGIPDAHLHALGLPTGIGTGFHEVPTFTCKHCTSVVVMNPERTRQRNFCRGCNHLICDGCAAIKATTGVCRTFDQVVDELLSKEH